MSSETGDPWRELTQARERDRIVAETYNQQQTSYRELEALYQAMTERALAAEAERDNARRDAGDLWSVAAECMKILGQDAEAWRQAAKRLERQRDKAKTRHTAGSFFIQCLTVLTVRVIL